MTVGVETEEREEREENPEPVDFVSSFDRNLYLSLGLTLIL